MKNRRIIFSVVIVLLLSLVTVLASTKKDESVAIPIEKISLHIQDKQLKLEEELKRIEANEWPAQEAYNRLLAYLENAGKDLKNVFGGAFLHEETQLAVLLTDMSPDNTKRLSAAIDFAYVAFIPCEYSLDELTVVFEELCKRNESKPYPYLSEMGIYIPDNRITVSFSDSEKANAKDFENWFELTCSDMILYSYPLRVIPATIVYAGEAVSPGRSVGYRGYRIADQGDIYRGFTSCGHSVAGSIRKGNTTVGNLYSYAYSGNADFSFYDAAGSTTMFNLTAYTDDSGSSGGYISLSTTEISVQAVLTNRTMFKCGGTTYLSSGKILSTNYYNGLSNMIKSNAYAQPGDSGCVAFIYDGGVYKIIGSASSISNSNGAFQFSYFSQYHNNKFSLYSTIYRY